MIPKLSNLLNRPLRIGTKTIPNRLVLAPMTFLGHVAYRQVLEHLGGCGLMFSEMCSAARIPHENPTVSVFFRWRDAEREHLSVQILGADPDRMAAAARRVEAEGLWGVDINLGCAVSTVCKYNQGAALLRNTDAILTMVEGVRQAIRCPLTVKFRTGWQDDPRLPVSLARQLEAAGVDALTFHPRVAPDRRNRPPKWEYIGLVKEAVSIPVFGNGNVFDADECLKMLQTTGCDGVALGRIAIARPWVFGHWTGAGESHPTICRDVAVNLLELLRAHFTEVQALRRYQRYAVYLAANFTFGNSLYNRIRNAAHLDAIRDVLDDFFANDPIQCKRPNLNFMQ